MVVNEDVVGDRDLMAGAQDAHAQVVVLAVAEAERGVEAAELADQRAAHHHAQPDDTRHQREFAGVLQRPLARETLDLANAAVRGGADQLRAAGGVGGRADDGDLRVHLQ